MLSARMRSRRIESTLNKLSRSVSARVRKRGFVVSGGAGTFGLIVSITCASSGALQNGPGQQAEADDQQYTAHRTAQRARPRTNSTNVPTGTPVGPRGTVPRSDSVYAVPAMSRCTHG